jgi:type I restriction enzyme M protein
MITGELKSKIDRIWDAMWAGGIANPLTVIEQLTYLLFIKRLDELHTLRERKAARTGQLLEDPIFPFGLNPASRHGRRYDDLRWSRFRDFAPETVFEIVRDEVFPFLKTLGKGTGEDGSDSTYAHHMKDALFMFPSPRLLANVIDQLDGIDMADRDTKGDLYEYMLGKIASAGQNGQFRTPRHIIRLMVEMIDPKPADLICDPACGTCGFLVASAEHLREHHGAEIFADAKSRRRFNEQTFHGYDFDTTMLRIGSMNMLLHGVENPDIRYKDSLEQAHAGDEEAYTVILANPPFAGSLDYEATAKDLLQIVKTKKTELLFLALFLRLLKTGGRAAVIVPDGVLFGSSKAHKQLRRTLVEDQKLDAVISMPSGVFKPYAGVSTAILLFTKTNSGGTDGVWFYDMKADGFSLDDKRTPQDQSDLPDLLQRWKTVAAICDRRTPSPESERPRTAQSFLVPKAEIAANDYDLSLNRYKEVVHESIEHDSPGDILARLAKLEDEIAAGRKELEGLLG